MPRVLSESDVADFRERLCEAAERLFAQKGPDAVTMRQLAAELGVSPMTPYRYFADKEDILRAHRIAHRAVPDDADQQRNAAKIRSNVRSLAVAQERAPRPRCLHRTAVTRALVACNGWFDSI